MYQNLQKHRIHIISSLEMMLPISHLAKEPKEKVIQGNQRKISSFEKKEVEKERNRFAMSTRVHTFHVSTQV